MAPKEKEAAQAAARAARESSTLGPGTAGHTMSGAAYRGHEVAANTGAPHPAEVGFGDHYERKNDGPNAMDMLTSPVEAGDHCGSEESYWYAEDTEPGQG